MVTGWVESNDFTDTSVGDGPSDKGHSWLHDRYQYLLQVAGSIPSQERRHAD